MIERLRKALAAAVARAGEEHGFTMVVVMGVLLVATAFSVAAIAAADNDDPQARKDTDSKQAYAAAEAGINYYVFHLNNDNAFWSACTHSSDINLPAPTGLNQAGQAVPTSWRTVPGASSQFAIELLPANGAAQCDPNNAQLTMIDQNSGTFRIRSTGLANGVRRSIVATFKRRGFLDYVWFTDYEIRDPLVSGDPASCVKHIWEGRPNGCAEVNFVSGDNMQGPMHTNDQFLICGTPTFGRSGGNDKIEATDPNKIWRSNGACGAGNPTTNGAQIPGAPLMSLPPSNASLASLASGTFKPTGRIDIELRSSPPKICMRPMPAYPKYWTQNVTPYTCYDPPANGVLYVQSSTCGVTYDQNDPYNVPNTCGEAWVHGSYASNLTIGADKDVVVDGDVIRSGNSMLGLIANNFVRVYHPITSSCTNDTAAGSGLLGNLEVDAAILSLNHSWAVDNFGCGASLGTLTVQGAIAQKYRGTVGTTAGTGYIKSYQYDDRLVFRSPPSFLDPVQTSWRIARYNEQLPASTLAGP
ncbi:MAG: hypothetical protein ACJ768_07390 [Gaiellaceae bacterium]